MAESTHTQVNGNSGTHPAVSKASQHFDLIDAIIVLVGGAGVALFAFWLARVGNAEQPFAIPDALTNVVSWIATTSLAGIGWFFKRKREKAPSGERYLAWVFAIAVLFVISGIALRTPATQTKFDPNNLPGTAVGGAQPATNKTPAASHQRAADPNATQNVVPSPSKENRSLTFFREIILKAEPDRQVVVRTDDIRLSNPAKQSLDGFVRSPIFRSNAERFGRRGNWEGIETTGDAVQLKSSGTGICGTEVSPKQKYAAHHALECGTKIKVTAMGDKSITVPVLDRAGDAATWQQIVIGLSSAAMEELGIKGKGEVTFSVVAFPAVR